MSDSAGLLVVIVASFLGIMLCLAVLGHELLAKLDRIERKLDEKGDEKGGPR